MGADAGNKGREMGIILISRWCAERGTPVAEGLAASDLLGNFGAQNLANTLKRAADRDGLHPAGCAQAITDGASACAGENGESEKLLAKMRARAAGNDGAIVENAAQGGLRDTREGASGKPWATGGLPRPRPLRLGTPHLGKLLI
eukprot:3916097-Pleurochrysis_carterae.AAC.4